VERKTLSLKKPVDPEKIARSLHLGLRFIDRKGRYIMQARVSVAYGISVSPNDHTWVDIPLCPETYGEAQA
jgi:hypothetical protein